MFKEIQMPDYQQNPKYNLEERTLKYSKNIISFCTGIKQDAITRPLMTQLVRSGTSIGANYYEASEASSKKDFINKMCISHKEIKETKYWLEVMSHAVSEKSEDAKKLLSEGQELNLIFSTIIRKARENNIEK